MGAVAVRELTEATRRTRNPAFLASLSDLDGGVSTTSSRSEPAGTVVDPSGAALSCLLSDRAARRALANERLPGPHLIDSGIASGVRRNVAAKGCSPHPIGLHWTAGDLGMTRYATLPLLERGWELRDGYPPTVPPTLRQFRSLTVPCSPPRPD